MWTVNCHWVAFVSLSDNHILTLYTCPLFSVKCVRLFALAEPEFLKIYQRLPKIAKDFRRLPKIAEDFRQLLKTDKDFETMSEDNRRCRTIFKDFQMISKGFPTNLKHYSRVPKKFLWLLENQNNIEFLLNWFLSGCTRYCQLGARNWSECVRLQF